MLKVSLAELTKHFAEEKDIYIQNVSDGIVSLSFGNKDEVGYSVPHNPNPVCLTSIIPFKMVKDSITFRKALLRVPPFIRLLTEEEYKDYYDRKAQIVGIKVEELIEKTEEKQSLLQTKPVITTEAPEPVGRSVEPETMDEVLTPRVMQIVATLNTPVEEGNKVVLTELLDELEIMSAKLGQDDLEYIRSQGRFKSIKKWATTKMDEREKKATLSAEEIEDKVNKNQT